MPVQLSYPGVYIEEVPSGVRTIVGVATSITAFIGRAPRGPVGEPVVVTGYGDFERIFGGLWAGSRLGFAVRDFYLNGGGTAVIVRLYHESGDDAGGDDIALPNARLTWGTGDAEIVVEAAQPGAWGNRLRFRVDWDTRPPDPDLGEDPATEFFNLTVRDGSTGTIEQHRNLVATTGQARSVDGVLARDSLLVQLVSAGPDRPPEHDDAAPGTSVWDDQTTGTSSTRVPATGAAADGLADDGIALVDDDFIDAGSFDAKRGLYALENADLFNLLVIPPYTAGDDTDTAVVAAAAAYCERRRAVYLAATPAGWDTVTEVTTGFSSGFDTTVGTNSRNAALYFPRLRQPNPLLDDQVESFSPVGAVAGVIARTDSQRGVWKSPAGQDATLTGVPALEVALTDGDIGQLNPLGVNCLRAQPGVGRVVWGARTMRGADRLADEWKYLAVRRTALFIEESLFRGTQWVVFEPNDEPLWAQIRLNVGTFMDNLFRQGAFQGVTPRDAYFVKCDRDTTTQAHIDLGIVNIHVGFAPLKPAEFVVIRLQQMAGAPAA
jgi:phage tail sheath protein FI